MMQETASSLPGLLPLSGLVVAMLANAVVSLSGGSLRGLRRGE